MKKLFLVFLVLSTFSAFATTTEGRLVAKLNGELDPFVLGDGCLSIVEYYDENDDDFKTIGIFEAKEDGCINENVDENEELDFDIDGLSLIRQKKQLKILSHLTVNILNFKDSISFYELR